MPALPELIDVATPSGTVAVGVVEVVAEAADALLDPPEMTPALDAAVTGTVHIQLRHAASRVTVGSGLARRAGLLDAVRALPGAPLVTTTVAGGTFVVGGPRWLALSAVGRPPAGRVLPLDWMLAALRGWLSVRLVSSGLPELVAGRVEGAWCPGFSDLGWGGRKLVGLGFRVTRERVLARGMIAVDELSDPDLALLQACHSMIGVAVAADACTSLSQLGGAGAWTAAGCVTMLTGVPDSAPPGGRGGDRPV